MVNRRHHKPDVNRLSILALRFTAIILLALIPITAMVLDALCSFELTAEWVTLYGIIAGSVAAVFGLANKHEQNENQETQ